MAEGKFRKALPEFFHIGSHFKTQIQLLYNPSVDFPTPIEVSSRHKKMDGHYVPVCSTDKAFNAAKDLYRF